MDTFRDSNFQSFDLIYNPHNFPLEELPCVFLFSDSRLNFFGIKYFRFGVLLSESGVVIGGFINDFSKNFHDLKKNLPNGFKVQQVYDEKSKNNEVLKKAIEIYSSNISIMTV